VFFMADTIWVARHGNRQDFAYDDWRATAARPYDPGLAADGVVQAERLARRVAALGIARIVASPFLRAVQTAYYAACATGQPVRLEPGLGEWQNPNWFSTAARPLPPQALRQRFACVDPSDADPPCIEPDYPEDRQDAFDRIGRAARCLARRHDGPLLLVAHGITVQGVLRGLVGPQVPDERCPLASLTQVVRQDDGAWHVAQRNDTSHLDAREGADRLH
jgi:broad specificity phosphatase PhoE